MCEDNGLTEAEKIRRLSRYCEMLVGQTLQGLNNYAAKKWDPLVKEIKKKYKAGDYSWGDFDCLYRPIFDKPCCGNTLFGKKRLDMGCCCSLRRHNSPFVDQASNILEGSLQARLFRSF